MHTRLPNTIQPPMLPLPEQERHAVLTGAFWCASAVFLHALVYAAARFASHPHVVDAGPKAIERDHVVIIRDPPPAAPPRPTEPAVAAPKPSEIEAAIPREETTASRKRHPEEPRRRAAPAKADPPSKTPETVFRDVGVLGSLDVGATGPGGSLAVAVGTGGIDGAILRSGRIEGVVSPGARGNGAKAPVAELSKPPRPASIRDLRRKAVPKTQHNRSIKASYPKQLREKAVSGEVLAVLLVLADGSVGRVKIVRSDDEAFTASAIRVLKQFLFEPAIDREGKAVAGEVRLTYKFLLE